MDKSHLKHIDLRLINESGERGDDHRVDSLAWNAEDELAGKSVHLRGFPKGHQLKLFRWTLSTKRTDDVVTNDPAQLTTEAVQEASGLRWKGERTSRWRTGPECSKGPHYGGFREASAGFGAGRFTSANGRDHTREEQPPVT